MSIGNVSIGNEKNTFQNAFEYSSCPRRLWGSFLDSLGLFHCWLGGSWFRSWLEPLDTGLCLAEGIGLVFLDSTSLDAME